MKKDTNTASLSGSGFTVVENELIQDPEIHPLAKFLYVWMHSVARIPNFTFWQNTLLKVLELKDRRVLSRYIKQLLDKGWLYREENRESGRFKGYHYTINQVPFHHTITGERQTPDGNIPPVSVSTATAQTHTIESNNLEERNNDKKSNTKVLLKKIAFPPVTEQQISDFKNALYLHALERIKDLVGSGIDPKAHAKDFALAFYEHYSESGWRKNNNKKLTVWKSAASGWISRSARNDEYLVHAESSKEYKEKQRTGKQRRQGNNQNPTVTTYDRNVKSIADKMRNNK